VEERYKDLIVALYGDKEKLEVVADIRYRDGKDFRMKTNVTIMEVSQEKQDS
jgi:hypothetical protein